MSKKKNTLSDLEEFLKLQASSLVTPTSLTYTIVKEEVTHIVPTPIIPIVSKEFAPQKSSVDEITKAVHQLALSDKKAFYSFIVNATKYLPNYATEDALLINTALYLKGGKNWKEVVKEHWKKN